MNASSSVQRSDARTAVDSQRAIVRPLLGGVAVDLCVAVGYRADRFCFWPSEGSRELT